MLRASSLGRRPQRSVTKSKKLEHVIHVMRVLGIEHIRNNLVGDAEKRGISGGQKKRVNIGVELVAMPAIVFMDECAAPAHPDGPWPLRHA